MTIQRFLIVLMKWLAAFALAAGIVMLIRLFCIESYRISTDSMEEALHKGDYILVNKIPGKISPSGARSCFLPARSRGIPRMLPYSSAAASVCRAIRSGSAWTDIR